MQNWIRPICKEGSREAQQRTCGVRANRGESETNLWLGCKVQKNWIRPMCKRGLERWCKEGHVGERQVDALRMGCKGMVVQGRGDTATWAVHGGIPFRTDPPTPLVTLPAPPHLGLVHSDRPARRLRLRSSLIIPHLSHLPHLFPHLFPHLRHTAPWLCPFGSALPPPSPLSDQTRHRPPSRSHQWYRLAC